MASSLPTSQALRSQVFREPLGPLVAGALLGGGGILLLPAGAVAWFYSRPASGLLLVLGGTLLAAAWRLATRSLQLCLLTLSPEELRLTPFGQGVAPGHAAETIPLTSIVAYKHWRSQGRVFSRYYLRLELVSGRVLRLADPPDGPLKLAGRAVPLRELAAQLACWVDPATVAEPRFSQTTPARRLMQGSWLLLFVALGLTGQGYLSTGISLTVLASVYLLSYHRTRRQAGSP